MGSAESVPSEETAVMERRNRNIKRMDQAVRKKLRGGVQFNMKILIRGAPGTGKTSLWRRLQGQPISRNHEATSEIQTANINWAFKNAEETVKVEVWDCVDRLSVEPEDSSPTPHVLDTTTVNVYQNAQAVIFMVSPSDQSSLDYIVRSMRECPPEMSVLVLLNFKDLTVSPEPDVQSEEHPAQSHGPVHDGATKEETENGARNDSSKASASTNPPLDVASVREYLEPHMNGNFHCFECSMLNCFGLKLLYTYLNVPFLALKKRNLEQALHVLEQEAVAAKTDLERLVDENPYGSYLEHLQKSNLETNRKRSTSEVTAPRRSEQSILKQGEDMSTPLPDSKIHSDEVPSDVASSTESLETSQNPTENVYTAHDHPPDSVTTSTENRELPTQDSVVPGKSVGPGDDLEDEMNRLDEKNREDPSFQHFFEGSDEEEKEFGDTPPQESKRSGEDDGELERSEDSGVESGQNDERATLDQELPTEDDASSDDEFYASPKFGLSSLSPHNVASDSPGAFVPPATSPSPAGSDHTMQIEDKEIDYKSEAISSATTTDVAPSPTQLVEDGHSKQISSETTVQSMDEKNDDDDIDKRNSRDGDDDMSATSQPLSVSPRGGGNNNEHGDMGVEESGEEVGCIDGLQSPAKKELEEVADRDAPESSTISGDDDGALANVRVSPRESMIDESSPPPSASEAGVSSAARAAILAAMAAAEQWDAEPTEAPKKPKKSKEKKEKKKEKKEKKEKKTRKKEEAFYTDSD